MIRFSRSWSCLDTSPFSWLSLLSIKWAQISSIYFRSKRPWNTGSASGELSRRRLCELGAAVGPISKHEIVTSTCNYRLTWRWRSRNFVIRRGILRGKLGWWPMSLTNKSTLRATETISIDDFPPSTGIKTRRGAMGEYRPKFVARHGAT